MCKAMEDMRNEAVDRARTQDIRNLMKNLNMTAQQVLDALGLSDEEKRKYAKLI